ncbi:MAG: SLC13 family permease [Candidatus Latescibacteria bacterium]|jgi:anion transporter|nr:SLC13 family permease [Candidatus Latescibacterota bacterium]
MPSAKVIGLVLGILLPLVALLIPGELDVPSRLALAVCALTVVFWTFEPVPIEYTSILTLLLFPILGIMSFETTFHAFSGKAVWLIFSGMALSLTISETPLGPRLARLVLGRIGSYGRLVLSLHLLGIVLAILIPSGVVRILILMPMLVSLLKAIGEAPGSRVSAALILSLACSTYYGGTGILTASVPNLVVFGAMEARDITFYWGEWALYMLPVIGLVRTGCCYLLVRLLLRVPQERSPTAPPAEDASIPARISPPERKAVGILLLGILLWATDALHGIHPAYVGLLLVLLCYLPGWGPLAPGHLRKINFPILIYVAAAFAMGYAMEDTGLNDRMGRFLTGWLDLSDSHALAKLGAVTYLLVPADFLADTAAIAAILTPLLLDFGADIGLAAIPTALSVAIGTSLVFIPYQSAPFMLAYSFRYVRMGQFILLMSLISLITLIILVPLNLLYWRLIGFV